MNRRAEKSLLSWKDSNHRKPLLLLGARQVGKTWLMNEFGRKYFEKVLYVRFDRNEQMRQLFERSSYDMNEMLLLLQAAARFKIEPGKTLIILDEIQECPAALTSLKYFCEDLPEYHVMAAGSLLGVHQHRGTGFPVGKVHTLHLYPMSFPEFLDALGYGYDVEIIESGNWQNIKLFAERYTHLLKLYYYIGGMPEVVSTYIETQDFAEVRRVQNEILSNYANDFSKHVPASLAAKLSLLWDSVPEQLAKENRKFIFAEVQKNMRARDLEDAMDWLIRAGLVYRTPRINEAALPISAYRDGAFKLYFSDVGLLGAKVGLDISVLVEKTSVFREFKGALTKQYVQQQMRAECALEPHYWQSDTARAEIDFIIQQGMHVVPVEVKAETNTRAKSLMSYCRKYQPHVAVRCSMNDYHKQVIVHSEESVTQLIDIPLYAVSQMTKECKSALGLNDIPTPALPPPNGKI